MSRRQRWAIVLVFVGLLGSNAYFWHSRDWNVSSRLMLTYALADRGALSINGLEDHTGDRARIGRRYYTDKLPGFSLLAIPPYLALKTVLGLPDHPLNVPGDGFTHWPSDYWITLATSGFATALVGAMLVVLAFDLGCGPRRAALVGLAYGLATPAFVYGTLAYGHQLTACCLLGSFLLIQQARRARRPEIRAGLAGLLAALASVIELQVGPVSAILGVLLVALVIRRKLSGRCLVTFGSGALIPTFVLLTYNQLAFGSPLDMGYFHEDVALFRDVHNAENPLGLGAPDWSKAVPLLWGPYRGLLFHAPILALAPLGWMLMVTRRQWEVLIVTIGASLAVFLVNLSYPQWTGGFSTGPRLLTPMLPFAMPAVAVVLGSRSRVAGLVAVALSLIGWAMMLMFQGAGGRVPPSVADPLREFVLPIWQGARDPASGISGFSRNAFSVIAPEWATSLPSEFQWIQFLPLIAFQALIVAAIWFGLRESRPASTGDRVPE